MKILLLSIFSILGSMLYSQGNLQFNQVINMSYNYNFLNYGQKQTVGSVTVPVGKVWKIESAIPFNYSGTSQFLVNNFTVLYNNPNNQPIWLKSVDNCRFTLSSTLSSYSISIIEFNVVP